MEKLYLSRRNLKTLLSKLDRAQAGEETLCTIIKYKNPDTKYFNTIDSIAITAVEDEELYKDRIPGQVHLNDRPNIGEIS